MSSFKEFQENGLLWALNRMVLHPRGYAVAFEMHDDDDGVGGWFLMGDGTEVWAFDQETDDSGFERFTRFIKERSNG